VPGERETALCIEEVETSAAYCGGASPFSVDESARILAASGPDALAASLSSRVASAVSSSTTPAAGRRRPILSSAPLKAAALSAWIALLRVS
jgi:hypothetical protein